MLTAAGRVRRRAGGVIQATNSFGLYLAEGGGVNNASIDVVDAQFEGNPGRPDLLHYAVRVDNCDGFSLSHVHMAWAQFGLITLPATAASSIDTIQAAICGFDTCTNTGIALANNGATIHTGTAGGHKFTTCFFYLSGRHVAYSLTAVGSQFAF